MRDGPRQSMTLAPHGGRGFAGSRQGLSCAQNPTGMKTPLWEDAMDQSVREPPTGAWPAGPDPRPVLGLSRSRGGARRTGADIRRSGLAFSVPGDRRAGNRRLPHHHDGRDARRGGPRRGRRNRRVRKPMCPSRLADLPGRWRQGEGFPVRLSRLALRSARQPDLDRVPPRRQRQGRHAGRLPDGGARPAQAAHGGAVRPGVRHAGAGRTRPRGLYRARGPGAAASRAAQESWR